MGLRSAPLRVTPADHLGPSGGTPIRTPPQRAHPGGHAPADADRSPRGASARHAPPRTRGPPPLARRPRSASCSVLSREGSARRRPPPRRSEAVNAEQAEPARDPSPAATAGTPARAPAGFLPCAPLPRRAGFRPWRPRGTARGIPAHPPLRRPGRRPPPERRARGLTAASVRRSGPSRVRGGFLQRGRREHPRRAVFAEPAGRRGDHRHRSPRGPAWPHPPRAPLRPSVPDVTIGPGAPGFRSTSADRPAADARPRSDRRAETHEKRERRRKKRRRPLRCDRAMVGWSAGRIPRSRKFPAISPTARRRPRSGRVSGVPTITRGSRP